MILRLAIQFVSAFLLAVLIVAVVDLAIIGMTIIAIRNTVEIIRGGQ